MSPQQPKGKAGRIAKKTPKQKEQDISKMEIEFDPVADLGETPSTTPKECEAETKVEEPQAATAASEIPQGSTEPSETKVEEHLHPADTGSEVKEEKKETPKKRVLKDKKQTVNDKGQKSYEYTYDIVDAEGKVVTQQTVTTAKKVSETKKYDPSMNEELGKCMKEWLESTKIEKPTLYKRTVLDKHLKDIGTYVKEHQQIKLTQKQIREIFRSQVLEIHN